MFSKLAIEDLFKKTSEETTIDGHEMELRKHAETDAHFANLESFWDTRFNETTQ